MPELTGRKLAAAVAERCLGYIWVLMPGERDALCSYRRLLVHPSQEAMRPADGWEAHLATGDEPRFADWDRYLPRFEGPGWADAQPVAEWLAEKVYLEDECYLHITAIGPDHWHVGTTEDYLGEGDTVPEAFARAALAWREAHPNA